MKGYVNRYIERRVEKYAEDSKLMISQSIVS